MVALLPISFVITLIHIKLFYYGIINLFYYKSRDIRLYIIDRLHYSDAGKEDDRRIGHLVNIKYQDESLFLAIVISMRLIFLILVSATVN